MQPPPYGLNLALKHAFLNGYQRGGGRGVAGGSQVEELQGQHQSVFRVLGPFRNPAIPVGLKGFQIAVAILKTGFDLCSFSPVVPRRNLNQLR